jgi:Xaa-Pro aminopeptidase
MNAPKEVALSDFADFIGGLAPQLKPLDPPGPVHGQAHQQRRQALAAQVAAQGGGVVVLSAGGEIIRNHDNPFAFRSHSDFFYMTGFPEPDAWWVMCVKENGQAHNVIACRPRDTEREIWDGVRVGPERAAAIYGVDQAINVAGLDDLIISLAKDQPAFFTHMGVDAQMDSRLRQWLSALRAKGRAGVSAPDRVVDIGQAIAKLRMVKDTQELATMQRAGDISSAAHVRAMQRCRVGMREYELEAELLHGFRSAGAQSVAYGSIVASGPHSCILHHRAGDRAMQHNELVLIDAGCELDGYASDITRTFPVNGHFTSQQRAVYDIVLAAQEAAIAVTKPGAQLHDPHDAAVRVLAQGMLDLKLITDQSLEDVLAQESYKRFYMHRTGHWLGLDVHDTGDYKTPLSPGMVLTVEPGFYIRPAPDIDPGFWNIGIRIEDDAVVTTTGCRLLSRGVPVRPDEIEALMHG